MPEARLSETGVVLTDVDPPESGWRFRAALLRWEGATANGRSGVTAVAWEGPEGGTYWGWPGDAARVELRRTDAPPEVSVAFPPAISLVFALRRGRVEIGAHCLVVGADYLGRLASAVAATTGCRVRTVPAPHDGEPSSPRPDIVIETTGRPGALAWALAQCADWGAVHSFGSALAGAPLDYYADVHRRALSLHRVPYRPCLSAEEQAVAERGLPILGEALGGLRLEADATLPLQGLPPGQSGVALRESPGGWCLLRA